MLNRFLVPLDGSECGELALPWAEALGRDSATEFQLLRCCQSGKDSKKAASYLESVVRHHDIKVRGSHIQQGEAGSCILSQAQVPEIDAILLSSHGYSGFDAWLLGSVATEVLRGSDKPVLVIRAGEEPLKPKDVQRILVGLDGSREAEAALEPALEMAQRFGARLHLFQAVPFKSVPYKASPKVDIEEALEQAADKCRRYLQGLAARYPEHEMTIEARNGHIVDGLIQASEDCQMIVLTSHGHGGFKRWLLGSVTEQILQKSTMPLLVVHGSR